MPILSNSNFNTKQLPLTSNKNSFTVSKLTINYFLAERDWLVRNKEEKPQTYEVTHDTFH
jgi:hypothetical protein